MCQRTGVDGTQVLNCEVNQWMKSVLLFVDLSLEYKSCIMSFPAGWKLAKLQGWRLILSHGKIFLYQREKAWYFIRELIYEHKVSVLNVNMFKLKLIEIVFRYSGWI